MSHDNDVPNDLAIRCPHCGHDLARLLVNSYSVVTLTCATCSHRWSVEISSLPDSLREQLSQPVTPKHST